MENENASFFEVWTAIKQSDELLTATERWVLTVMVGHCNFHHSDGSFIWPSDRTIATQAGFGARTVRACRRKFRQIGLLEWTKVQGAPNRTFVDLDAILELPEKARSFRRQSNEQENP